MFNCSELVYNKQKDKKEEEIHRSSGITFINNKTSTVRLCKVFNRSLKYIQILWNVIKLIILYMYIIGDY